jgi:arginyl-tRNA synthetase
MIIKRLKNRILEQVAEIAGDGFDVSAINLSEPRNKKFGDLATNTAMVLAPVLKENPMDIAQRLVDSSLSKWKEIRDINIAKPGFINFNLDQDFIKSELVKIAGSKHRYGTNNTGKGISINSEYVSANPTGELHIGHGRWAVLGDVLSNIYQANGYDIVREYYINDYGSQIAKFAECVKASYLQKIGIGCDYPGDGYPKETADKVADMMLKDPVLKKTYATALDIEGSGKDFGKSAVKLMLGRIKDTLSEFGVDFDVWFEESSLHAGDNLSKVMDELRSKKLVFDKEGATWFASSRYGDDKDRVVIRKDGEPTYFASDIMYLMDKKNRGYKKIIYILGADHHGYVKRLKAIGQAIGLREEDIKIIIGQLVKLVRSGKAIKMSKRKGQVYSLRDLVAEVGKDPVRYFFSANSFDTPMDFDIDLAKEKSNKNPVYYVQYAHARIESIINNVVDKGYVFEGLVTQEIKEMKIPEGQEAELAKALIFYPDVIYDCWYNDSPHYLVQYIYDLSGKFHHFYNHFRVIEDDGLKTDRFKLVLLVKIVLENALGILGIEAPEKM